MTVRLHHHSILEADKVNAPTTLITGTGPIDLNPDETIRQIAKTVQEKAGVDSSSFDYGTQHNFKEVMMSKDCQKIFKARQVVKPTVSIKEKESKHAIVSDYDSNLNPDDYRAVKALLNTLQAEFDRNWIGFFHYERKLPKKTMLETLLRRTQTEEVSTVLSELKQSYPNDHAVFKGWRSHRTKDLFDKLERDYSTPPSPALQ